MNIKVFFLFRTLLEEALASATPLLLHNLLTLKTPPGKKKFYYHNTHVSSSPSMVMPSAALKIVSAPLLLKSDYHLFS